MALKTQIDAAELDEMPEALREYYTESSEAGKYDLATDGDEKLAEFRAIIGRYTDRSRSLKKPRRRRRGTQSRAGRGQATRREGTPLRGQDRRVARSAHRAMRGSYDERIADLTNKLTDAEKTLDVSIVENQIRDAAIKRMPKMTAPYRI